MTTSEHNRFALKAPPPRKRVRAARADESSGAAGSEALQLKVVSIGSTGREKYLRSYARNLLKYGVL